MAKAQNLYEPHLALMELSIAPGGEWAPHCSRGWLMLQIASGTGYWLQAGMNQELPCGTVLLLSDQVEGLIRASQLGAAMVRLFRIDPARLTGLVSFEEQACLSSTALKKSLAFRIIPPHDPLAIRLAELRSSSPTVHVPANGTGNAAGNAVLLRARLVELFFENFGGEFGAMTPASTLDAPSVATERLREFLAQLPAAELLEMNFSDLVDKMLCTPRHLGRIFHEVVGMSFREKQTELRLARACELLATTETKVLNVALESGYQSLSLFNMMFKKRYGLTPGQWREKARATRPAQRQPPRLRVLRA